MISILKFYFLLASLLFLTGQTAAASPWDSLKELQAEIDARVSRETASYTPEAFAAGKNISWPIPSPAKSFAEILQAAQGEALDLLNRRYPDPPLSAFQKKAEERYPLYRRGDRVTLQTFHPSTPEISGIIADISAGKVIIGGRWISFRDLNPRDRLAFNPAKTGELRMEYARQLVRERNRRKQLLLRRMLLKTAPEALQKNGYIQVRVSDKGALPVPEDWISGKEQFLRDFQKAKELLIRTKTEEYQNKILPEKGFCKDSRTGRWRPMTLWEKLRK